MKGVALLCGLWGALVLPAPALSGTPGALVGNAVTVLADLSPGDTDAYAVPLCEGDTLGVSVKSKAAILPGLRVFRPDGVEVPVGAYTRVSTKAVTLSGLPVQAGWTGLFKVVVSGGVTAAATPYTAAFRVTSPKSYALAGRTVPAGDVERWRFGVGPGAVLDVSITEASGPPLAAVRLLDSFGAEVPLPLVRKGARLSAKGIALGAAFGECRLEFTGAAAGPTVVGVKLKAKYPKAAKRTVVLGPEARLTGTDTPVIRQEETGLEVVLTGESLPDGSTVEVSGAGVEVVSAEASGGATVHLVLDADADAPYGPRDVVLFPLDAAGEPAILAGGLKVHAPDPVIASVSGAATLIRQGESGLGLLVSGAGFRSGGALSVSGTGVSTASVIPFATQVSATVDAALFADPGPRAVVWRQPEEGGGAQAVFEAGVIVHYPTPEVHRLSLPCVKRGGGPTVTRLLGHHFRPDGELSFPDGISVLDEEYVSPDAVRLTIEAEAGLPLGAVDVTYAHAPVGGGASAILTGGLTVADEDRSAFPLSAVDADHKDLFGHGVALEGDVLLVGSPDDDDNGVSSGSAYRFAAEADGRWTQKQKLFPGDSFWGDRFAVTLSLRGLVAVFGCTGDDTTAADSGAVYVFRSGVGVPFTEEAKLKAAAPVGNTGFGSVVAFDGTTVVVGAPGETVSGKAGAGAAYVYTLVGGVWTQRARLTASDAGAGHGFGGAVAIDGTWLLVGAPDRPAPVPGGPVAGAGAVYAFQGASAFWTERGVFTAATPVEGARFGRALVLSGSRAFAGGETKAAWSFLRNGDLWIEEARFAPPVGESNVAFGRSLAFDPSTSLLAVGDPLATDRGADSGAVCVYWFRGTSWIRLGRLAPAGLGAHDNFGASVAVSGFKIAVGAEQNTTSPGTWTGRVFVCEAP